MFFGAFILLTLKLWKVVTYNNKYWNIFLLFVNLWFLEGGSPEEEEKRFSEISSEYEKFGISLQKRLVELQERIQLEEEINSLEVTLTGYGEWLTSSDGPSVDVCNVRINLCFS